MDRASEQAFLTAFDDYADTLFRHALYRVSDREKAKDLTQETFVKAWEYVRAGNTVREWKSFLFRVLNNKVIDEYRRKKDQSLDALLEKDTGHASGYGAVDGKSEIEGSIDEALLIEKVRRLLPQLSPEHEAALTLRYIDGLSPGEVAEVLEISENAASVRIHRAVAELKKLCAPFIPTP